MVFFFFFLGRKLETRFFPQRNIKRRMKKCHFYLESEEVVRGIGCCRPRTSRTAVVGSVRMNGNKYISSHTHGEKILKKKKTQNIEHTLSKVSARRACSREPVMNTELWVIASGKRMLKLCASSKLKGGEEHAHVFFFYKKKKRKKERKKFSSRGLSQIH